ncbi:MAG: transcriptional repressor [Prevotella sp.]|jgi:Fur family peroxide stress response transcriptional regulator|nr:transcriptional repressor [Prevotella sp.]MDR2001491.1 transcriptional repressor [Prevotella sp.]
MNHNIIEKLKSKGLKVTPQRIAIYEAVIRLNHPSADNIIEYIKTNHPHISVATVYKVLDSFVENNILKRVKTEKDIMRYDPVLSDHHHLYCTQTERIEDYQDEELTQLISDYLEKNKIKNFKVENIQLQITGRFDDNK